MSRSINEHESCVCFFGQLLPPPRWCAAKQHAAMGSGCERRLTRTLPPPSQWSPWHPLSPLWQGMLLALPLPLQRLPPSHACFWPCTSHGQLGSARVTCVCCRCVGRRQGRITSMAQEPASLPDASLGSLTSPPKDRACSWPRACTQ